MMTTEMTPAAANAETIDSQQAYQPTEFIERSGPDPDRRPGRGPTPMQGGPRLPGYRLLAEIGRGGMGVVYKAWHERLDRPVALKMILAGAHASSEQLDRFQTEAQAVAQIQDPGIVQIYDVGEHDGLPFFSLEFVSGGSLDKKMDGRPQSPREAASMVRKLALAMDKAHQRKIIHRDLKPANVLLTPEGEPKITDFGLAKRLEDDSHQTRSGAIMGTPSYMAPEQAWGLTREIGTHTDQYALGTILYEMLVGHVPFQGSSALETLELARTQEPVPPTRLQPKIPVDLETICLKCLQKESAKRYGDMATLAQELEQFLEGRPILARPIGQVERIGRWCRRNPKVAGLVSAFAVLIVTVTIGSIGAALRFQSLNQDLSKSITAEIAAKKVAQEKEAVAIVAKNEADKARVAAVEAQGKEAEERAKKEKELDRARKAISGALEQNKNAIEAPRLMCILINQRLSPIDGTREIREELIKTAIEGLRRYASTMDQMKDVFEDKEGALMVKRTLARINQESGKIAEEYERYDEALKYFQELDRLAEEMIAIDPSDLTFKKILAISKGTLGGFYLDRAGDGRRALDLFQQTLKIRREVLARTPADDGAKRGVCNALGAIARSYMKLRDPRKAREFYREEIQLRDQFSPAFAAQLEIRRENAGLAEMLGDLGLDLNDFDGARSSYNRSLQLRKAIVDEYPEENQAKRDVILSIEKIATLDLFELKPEAALEGYQQVLADARRRLDAYPKDNSIKKDLRVLQDVARYEYNVATAYLRLKNFEAAKEHYRACLDLTLGMNDDPRLKLNRIDLMIPGARCGRHVEAAKIARELCKEPPLDSRIYYFAACGFSLCVGSLADLPPSAENELLAKQYTDGAIEALKLAQGAGWNNPGDIRNDPDLDPIRNDPRFIALRKEILEAPAP